MSNPERDNRKRVILRAMEPEDLDMMYGIENDREVWDVTDTNLPYSHQHLRDFMISATNDIYIDKQVRLIITNAEDDFIGIIDLFDFNPQHQRAELGIVICKPFRDLGYGLAALEQLLDHAHSVLHLHQVVAIVRTDNVYSVRLLERAGFEHDTELKDWIFDGDKYHNAFLMHFFCKKVMKSFAD